MNQSTALAKLHKAYLKANNKFRRSSKSYDMRDFEFWQQGKQYTKVSKLLLSIQFLNLSPDELVAKEVIENCGKNKVENDIDFAKELVI